MGFEHVILFYWTTIFFGILCSLVPKNLFTPNVLYITKAQGTLVNLHGHPNGPLNRLCQAGCWGPSIKKGPPWSKLIFFYKLISRQQTKLNLQPGLSQIRYSVKKKYNYFNYLWSYLPPPLIMLNWIEDLFNLEIDLAKFSTSFFLIF